MFIRKHKGREQIEMIAWRAYIASVLARKFSINIATKRFFSCLNTNQVIVLNIIYLLSFVK
jgi:hypothetical protein